MKDGGIKSFVFLLFFLVSECLLAAPDCFIGPTWYDYREAYGGGGTFMNPYVISKPEHLAQLSYEVNEERKPHIGHFFVLTADINLYKTVDGERVQWIPIGFRQAGSDNGYRFQGVLMGVDTNSMRQSGWRTGLKHTISGMYIKSTGSDEVGYYGLFGRMMGLVLGVQLKDFYILMYQMNGSSTVGIGGLCGAVDDKYLNCAESNLDLDFMEMRSSIDGCHVEGEIDATGGGGDLYVGGVAAFTAENNGVGHTTSSVRISADGCAVVGGVVATGNGAIVDCAANVNISIGAVLNGDNMGAIGGIVGYLGEKMSVRACSSMGKLRIHQAPTFSAGGIGGKMCYGTQIRGCSSAVTIEALKGGYAGGIVGYMRQGNTSSPLSAKVENCAFSGLISSESLTKAVGGICGYSEWDSDIRIENCLFTGTMLGTGDVAAIVGYCKKSSENVGGCYYDKSMFDGYVCGTETTHMSVRGLTTEEMISGDFRKMSLLPTDDTAESWFKFATGFYPAVRCNSEWIEFYEVLQNNTSVYLEEDFTLEMFSYDNVNRENAVYLPGSWLCSVPVYIPKGDVASDLVTRVTAPDKNTNWEEMERTVTMNSKVSYDTYDYIRISNDTAFVTGNGLFYAEIKAVPDRPVEVWNRPMPLGGSKTLAFTANPDQVWDGTTATGLAAGTGIKEDPYIIKNGAQLAYAVQNNEEGEWYKQLCDITLNSHPIQYNKSYISLVPFTTYKEWMEDVDFEWNANYDGDGHLVRGAVIRTKESGLFGNISSSGKVMNLGVIDSYIDVFDGLLAYQMNGTVQNCLVQGLANPNRFHSDDSYLGYSGGICALIGTTNSDALVEDCVSAMYSNCTLKDYTPFVNLPEDDAELQNHGMVRNCLAVVPTSFGDADFNDNYTANGRDYIQNCFWLKGYEPTATGYTLSELAATMGQLKRWQCSSGYFPTLKTFAQTDIAKLMMIPVRTDDGYEDPDYHQFLLGFDRQLLFEPGLATWTSSDNDYVEADGDMGIVVPIVPSYDYNNGYFTPVTRYVLGQEQLIATLGKETIAIPVRTRGREINPGISFVDDHAREACMEAFDSNNDDILSLEEMKAITTEQTLTAFQTATAKQIRQFPEFRFFKAVDELTTQLNGLSNLEVVKLPYALESIGSDAFDGCTSLKEVTIPAKVSWVEPHPFYGSVIENVYVDPFNEYFVSRDGSLFDTNNVLVAYPNGRTGDEAVLKGTISEIAEGAIYKVDGLERLYFETTDYETVPYLNDDGIVSDDDNDDLIDVYVSDATCGSVLMESYYNDGSWDEYIDAGKLHCYYPLYVGDAKAATLYIGFPTELPADLQVYIVTETDEQSKVAYLRKMPQQVPDRTPVVIFAKNAGLYRLTPIEEQEPWKMYENQLNGVGRDGMRVYQSDSDRGSILTLGRNSSGNLGFFYYQGEFIQPYRAYLTYNFIQNVNARYSFVIDDTTDEEATGVETIETARSAESQLDGVWYSLDGRRLAGLPTRSGVYIVNGKKVVIR